MIVGDRFIVVAEGNGPAIDTLKDAIGKVNLGKLNGMKNQGIK